MKFKSVLLVGPPGAGKGTQGKILGTIPGFFHCASGDMFRSLTIESEIARIFLEYSGKGLLVPDEYTIKLWFDYIEKRKKTGQFNPEKDLIILDGMPRNRNQAEMLSDKLDVVAVFQLICANQNDLIQRLQQRALKENRLDDANIDVIKKRLDIYESETQPILNFYGHELVHRIDATQSPVKVLSDILNILTKKISSFHTTTLALHD
jgi:adenylate kinase